MNNKVKAVIGVAISLIVLAAAYYFGLGLVGKIEAGNQGGESLERGSESAEEIDLGVLEDPLEKRENIYGMNVIDGDTLLYNDETIRLLCVQAPEKGEDGYLESKDFLEYLMYGEENFTFVLGENGTPEADDFGRSLRFVYINSSLTNETILVNKEIVDRGYGKIYSYPGTDCSRMRE